MPLLNIIMKQIDIMHLADNAVQQRLRGRSEHVYAASKLHESRAKLFVDLMGVGACSQITRGLVRRIGPRSKVAHAASRRAPSRANQQRKLPCTTFRVAIQLRLAEQCVYMRL
jgi:hypothetical protein